MASTQRLSRRAALRLAGIGVVTIAAGGLAGCSRALAGRSGPAAGRAQTRSTSAQPFEPDVEIALKATRGTVSILPGQPTRVWTYQGEVVRGDPASLQTLPGGYLGPIVHLSTGQKVRVLFSNELDEPTIVHWHGLHVPAEMDGHPKDVVGPEQRYVYEFEIRNRAGTYWFHPHPHRRAGPQVYAGLAGLLLVSDPEEAALGLPGGDYDIPLVLQDRVFDRNNQFVYQVGGMMDQMMGVLGDRILVNGRPDFTLPVAARAYRLRLVNGSNARIYKLAWSDGTPLTVIATDGGLLERPVQREYVTLGPAERVELYADFSQRSVGTQLVLRSLSFEDGMLMGGLGGGMMGGTRGGMGAGQALPNGAPFAVLTVRVERVEPSIDSLPERLSTITRYQLSDAVNWDRPRHFVYAMQSMMTWAINGRTFEMEGVADDEIVGLDTLEVWELENAGRGTGMGVMGGMAMPHPVHIHGGQFQVLDRQVDPALSATWETVRRGYVDEGWKDTILLMPGERARLLLKFADFAGLFLQHCHNLEHEDQGMMRNYRVQA